MSLSTPDFTPTPQAAEPGGDVDLRELARDVALLKRQLDVRYSGPPYALVRESIDVVRRMTQDVFGKEPTIEQTYDYESPSDPVIVVSVEVSGDVDAIVERCNGWHSRLSEVPLEARTLFRLSLIPIETS